MMVPSKTLLAGLALAAMGTVGTAQSQKGLDKLQVQKIGHATIDMATGVITRGTSQQKSATLANAFTNTDTSGFYGVGSVTVSTSGNPQGWMDWGMQTADTGSDIVGQFSFGYGTTVTDTTLGGPGVGTVLEFYDGIAGFCADSGATPTASFSFTGLPGSSPGVGAGWLITVNLTGGFEFCSTGVGNNFGFNFITSDDYNGDGTRDTGPLLCYAGDPFGPNMNPSNDPDSNGQVDVFDVWDLNPTTSNCLGSFFFGGVPFNFSSWYLTFDTADASTGTSASTTFRNGGSNPANYAVTSDAVLGGTFAGSDTSAIGGLGVILVGYASPLSFPTSFGQLLVNIADPGGELLGGPTFFYAGGVANFALPVPKNLNLCGLTVSTQAVEFGGGISLHNANDATVGF